MRRLWVTGVLVFAVGCGSVGGGSGVLYGFVIDGITGARLNFFDDQSTPNTKDDPSRTDEIYAVVKGSYVRASPCDPHDATSTNQIDTKGCYRFTNLDPKAAFPVFVQRNGYQPFESRVDISTATAGQGELYGNIRLFPVGFQAKYEVQVAYLGAPVPGAFVNCRYQSTANALQLGEDFLAPEVSTTAPAIGGVSDSSGLVEIQGTSLVPGATYLCEAYLSDQLNQSILSGSQSFVAGVSAPQVPLTMANQASDPHAVYAVRSNVDDAADLLGNGAQMTVTFNRAVELVPGMADCMTASLTEPDTNNNATIGVMPTSSFQNGVSEQVNASISPDGLTLTLSYKVPTTPLDTGDRGTSFTFDGVYVRPAGGQDDAASVHVIGTGTACLADDSAPFSTAPAVPNLRTGAAQSNVLRLY